MDNDLALHLSKQLLWQALLIPAPVIGLALISSFIVSLLQAATQIQDTSLSTVPKILVVLLMLMLCGGWMLNQLVCFAEHMLSNLPVVLP